MRLAILHHRPGFSDYIAEIFRTWGLPLFDRVEPASVGQLSPAQTQVLVCPAGSATGAVADATVAYAKRGGVVVACLPDGALAAAAGIGRVSEKAGPLRLRVTGRVVAGLAGEMLPVIGTAANYTRGQDVEGLAYLVHPGRWQDESIGIASTKVGHGRIVALAFDLPKCVMLLRQGDPDNAERIAPEGACARASGLAAEIGPVDCGWIPFADLLARLLVDIVRDGLGGPVPMVHHLPGEAPAMLLYSGDEDHALGDWNRAECDFLTKHDVRMNLYIIPTATNTTPADAAELRRHHDLGVHPDLRSLDRQPIPLRVAEYDRQIRLFTEMYGIKTRSIRNHCLAWAGYLDLIEVQARHGIRMDANCVSAANYFKQREHAPYGAFGAAMPMRFTRPDGSLIDVIQQPTQFSDDLQLNDKIEYSAKFSPEQYEVIFARMLDDAATRFHTPIGVCVHPTNYVTYSGETGRMMVQQAQRRGIPVWSYDQWSEFWDARDSWRFDDVGWDGSVLMLRASGLAGRSDLCIALPCEHQSKRLKSVRIGTGAAEVEIRIVQRYGRPTALVAIAPTDSGVNVSAEYA
ncbi:MAG: hypothetical protein NTW19_19655 [Planctomycetota bacterium]|nr:hypothetical protein [Planctomycetota bacterium]